MSAPASRGGGHSDIFIHTQAQAILGGGGGG